MKCIELNNTPVPHHTHDCEVCIFLGQIVRQDNTLLDLYTCGQGCNLQTYIYRFGSKGPEYSSMGFPIKDSIYEFIASLNTRREEHQRYAPLFHPDWIPSQYKEESK